MGYQPARGGHAPGHLRDAFQVWLDAWEMAGWDGYNHPKVKTHEINGKPAGLRWLTGQLWNCTDCLPSEYCTVLDLQQGSTYAQAARKIRVEIGDETHGEKS